MLKKLLALLLAAILCFGLISCTSDDDYEDDDEEEVEKEEDEDEEKEEEDEEDEDDEDDTDVPPPSSPVKPEDDEKVEETEEDEKEEDKDKSEKDEEDHEEKKDYDGDSTPLLYKVTDDDGNVVWLFGSIHVGRDSFYPLPDYVIDAYESSDALAVEFDIIAAQEDVSAMTTLMYEYMYTDGTTIADHIPEDVYEDAVEILEECGYYNSMFDLFDISMWASFVDDCTYEQIEFNTDLGIDMHMLNRAKEDGKEIIDIESMEFQMGIIPSLSEETQIYLLESSIDSYYHTDELAESLDEMMDVWESGDVELFEELLSEEIPASRKERELYEEYNKALVTDRNISMAEFAMEALEDGEELFICVGAAHVVGEGAMAELLEEEGYTVEIVH